MNVGSGALEGSSGVQLEDVSKRFGDIEAVRGVQLEVERGEFFSLLGPSGCGKSTLLRLVGGFEQPDNGRIVIGGKDVTRVEPQRRPTAMVFQSYALFPTMTVGENVAYGLRVRRLPRRQRTERVAELLRQVDLSGLQDRPVTLLSGGQQQRVALARALAVAPDVILFDEPLSNLDVTLREQTRRELKKLQRRVGTTSIYVTHDQQEALALSDRIGIMREGRLLQVGDPRRVFRQPATAFVAQFLGWNVVTHPEVAERLTGEEPHGRVLAVRPEALAAGDAETTPVTDGRISTIQFLGTYAEWAVETDAGELRVWVSPDAEPPERVALRAREYVWLNE